MCAILSLWLASVLLGGELELLLLLVDSFNAVVGVLGLTGRMCSISCQIERKTGR